MSAADATPARATRPLLWSIRREVWEHPALYVAPATVAGVGLAAYLLSLRRLPGIVARDGDPMVAYSLMGLALILISLVVAVFYCLGALHGERRDRSLLFWKSLPVSDLTTVLAKAAIPLAVLPAIVFVIALASDLVMLLLGSAAMLANGVAPARLLERLTLADGWLTMAYGLVFLSLWYAPVCGWLMLVSAWARRMPALWAVAPPLALCLLERAAFGTSHLFKLLTGRLGGGFDEAFTVDASAGGGGAFPGPVGIDPVGFATSPGLWVGLITAAAFFATAAWVRRTREPS